MNILKEKRAKVLMPVIFTIICLTLFLSLFVLAGDLGSVEKENIWEPSDFYFASDSIKVNNGWLNKYDDYSYNQVVSKISMELNNSNFYLTNKKVNITIAYPKEQEFLDLKIIPRNPSEDKLFEEDSKYIPEKSKVINKNLIEDKTKLERETIIETKIDSLTIDLKDKTKLEIIKLEDYNYKTFEIEFKDDEEYLIQAFISSEYGLNEKLYIYVLGSFAGGAGTSGDPWQIETWNQLNNTHLNLTASYILMNDLDSDSTGYDTYASSSANGGAGWNPIAVFSGTFDGQGHTISDLYISRSSSRQGLFGDTSSGSTISNVGVVDFDITNTYYGGGLVGENEATITNCYSTGNVSGSSEQGGLVGYNIIGTITNCYSTASASGTNSVAGLVGYNYQGTITNCYSNGSVSGSGNDPGGLIGYDNDGTYNDNFWDNQTSGQEASGGGTGKTTIQMNNISTFNDTSTVGLDSVWNISGVTQKADDYADHSHIWNIVDDSSYPFLSWEYTESAGDSTLPTFTTIPANTTINYTQGFGVDFDAEDETEFDSYAINWTTLFQINQSGWLENSTANIPAGTYLINVTINDTSNNLNSTIYQVIVNKSIPEGSLTSDLGWTINESQEVVIGLSESNLGDNDVTYIVYRDGVSKTTGETWSPALGTYDYVLNTTGGANWTANASMDTQTLTVNDATLPSISITYPTAITYSENVSSLNYTASDTNSDSCWYSVDDGVTNSSAVNMGINFTGITSVGGSNTWTVYCNDSSNNINNDSITFDVNVLWSNTGYPYQNKSFRITEFINVSGNNFTLGGQPYKIIGANFYYALDYMTNHTYTDNGEKLNGSEDEVYEILNEMQYLGINVVRTWGMMAGGNSGGTNATWEVNTTGGHYNLGEKNTPGNYNETFFKAFDKFLYECSKRDIRPQITLINNWEAYGGMQWYLSHSDTSDKTYEDELYLSDNWWTWHDQFYTDADANTYFQNTISYILNRNNTYTGIKYKDDPTIFSWMIANEPRAKTGNHSVIANWCNDTATYIKGIDSNHLVTCGIESLGFNETWGEGSDMVSTYNNTASDYVTFAMNTGQWGYVAERVETSNDGVYMCEVSSSDCGISNANVRAFWAYGHNYTYNSRYHSNVPFWTPKLPRHGYDNWVTQNVKWANEIGKPVMLQELVINQAYNDATKDDVYSNAISNFYSNGGDGIMLWTMNSDSYYRPSSTSNTGNQDDGYGFYLSDNSTLKALSVSSIDAIRNATNYTTSLNSYKYNFIVNIGFASDTSIDNCSLYLNVSNGTAWTDYYFDQSNISEIIDGEDYVFEKQFNDTDEEVYWYTECYGDGTTITSSVEHIQIQTGTPVITLLSPEDSGFSTTDLVEFNYSVAEVEGLAMSYCELYIDDVLNKTDYTVSLDTTQSFYSSLKDETTYDWYVKCTDIDSNVGTSETRTFTVDLSEPYFTTIPGDESINYSNYWVGVDFDATDGISFDSYSVNNSDFTINESGYLNTSLIFGVGVYNLNITINDSANNLNSTIYVLTINKISPSANMQITGTTPIEYTATSDFSESETNTGDSGCSYSMDLSNDVYGVGTWTFNYSTSGCANYTAGNVTKDLVVNINDSLILGISGTSPIEYPLITDVSGSGCPDELTCSLDKANDVYGAGNEMFNYSTAGNTNYSASSINMSITIDQNTSLIIGLTATTPIIYGTTTDFTGSGCPGELTCALNISNGIYGVGTISANYSTAGNTNYSESSANFTVTINQAVSSIYLTLDDTQSNITINNASSIDLNCSTINGDGGAYLELWNNGSLINNGTSPIGNTTTFNNVGLLNISCVYEDTQNYSRSFETWWLNVSVGVLSNIANITIINPDGADENANPMLFSITTDEDATCKYSLNVGIANTTMTSSLTKIHQASQTLSDGNYNVTFYCNNSVNNESSKSQTFYFYDITGLAGDDGGGGGGTGGSTTVTTGEPVEPVTSVSVITTENLTSADLFDFEYFTGNWTKGEINKIEIYVYDINKILIDAEKVEIILNNETISEEANRVNTGKYIAKFELDKSIDEVKMKIIVTKGSAVVEKSISITLAEKTKFSRFIDFIQNPYFIVIAILVFSLFTFVIFRILR